MSETRNFLVGLVALAAFPVILVAFIVFLLLDAIRDLGDYALHGEPR